MPRTIKLSVEEWCKLAREGVALPITTTLKWVSMEPLIRAYKDPVTFIPINRELIPGDVILFERQDGAFVCHRVYKILDNGETILTWGDNAENPDAPIPRSAALGLAVAFEKNGKRYVLDSDEQRQKGLKWLENKWKRPAFIQYRKARLKIEIALREKGLLK